MILVIPRLVSPIQISPLRPGPLEPLKRLNDQEELRRWHREPCLFGVVVLPRVLGGSVTRPLNLIVMAGSLRLFGITLAPFVMIVSSPLLFISTVVSRIRCSGNRFFCCDDYVIFEHGILVSPLKQLINSCKGMQG